MFQATTKQGAPKWNLMEPNEKQKPKKGKSEHLLDLMLHLGQRAAPCGQRAAPLDQLRLRLRDYERHVWMQRAN